MTEKLKDDLLRGAKPIADELGWTERQVYHAHAKHLIPTFMIGSVIHARRSSLMKHFAELERRAVAG
jgi:hypothetical protein